MREFVLVFSPLFDDVICVIPLSFLEFGVHLAELTVDPQGALAIRQVSLTVIIKVFCWLGKRVTLFLSFLIMFSCQLVLSHCLFAVSVCHSEAICGDSLVFPVREVQTSRNYRPGVCSLNWFCLKLAEATSLKSICLPPPHPQAKAAIRELLPGGLREAISKVRSSVAYAVSAIAHWDWPEAWPQLFNQLMEMLVSGDVNAVHGAMRVLTGM